MQGGGNELRRTIARLRVLTIRQRDVKASSYRIEMRLVEFRVTPEPYVHRR